MMSAALYLLLLGVFEVTRSSLDCNRTVRFQGWVNVRCRLRHGADSVLLKFDSKRNSLILECKCSVSVRIRRGRKHTPPSPVEVPLLRDEDLAPDPTASSDHAARGQAQNGTYSCSTMSEAQSVIKSSMRMTATAPVSLEVIKCLLDEPLTCALGAINPTDVKTLILSRTRGELLPRHVAGLTSVKELRMYFVKTSMPYSAASHLPALSVIDSHGYFLVNKEPDQHFLQLRELKLTDVELKVLPARSFTSTPNLFSLKLTRNQIHIIGKGAFEGLSSLKELHLYDNKIHELAAGYFSDVKLKELFLDYNMIEKLSLGVFASQAELETLDLSKNSIRYAPTGVFNNLANLTWLSLRDNKLEQLQSRSFEYLHSLLTLDLSLNHLTTLSPFTFMGLHSLLELNLSYNLLTTLSHSTFDVLRSLQKLRVSHNQLQIHDITSPFRELRRLTELQLQYNRLERVCHDWHELPNLKMLDLSHNVISRLMREDMMWNSSANINFSSNKITNIKVQKFIELPYVNLNNNPFDCDCTLYPFIKELKNADLSYNEEDEAMICSSPPGLAGRLVSSILDDLQRCLTCPNSCTCAIISTPTADFYELNCSSVPIYFPSTDLPFQLILNSVPNNITDLPAEVEHLIMSNLSMTELPYIDACSTTEVDLRHNLLTEAPLNLLKANCSVKLAHNLFKCDCDNQQTLMLLKKYDNLIIDLSEVTCGDGLAIKNYRVEELCVTRDSILLGLSISVGLVFFGVCVILIYAKKTNICLYMIRYGLYHSRQADRSDKKYDAFVSFEDEDERYVYHQLLPKLESGRYPLSLCIPCRDWEVGGLISKQISRSVQESRATLVVLSAHYGKSTWRKIEFRTAQALHTIIVLVMNDVANRCSELELETYTSMNKCIKASDPMVWCKIKQAVGATGEGS